MKKIIKILGIGSILLIMSMVFITSGDTDIKQNPDIIVGYIRIEKQKDDVELDVNHPTQNEDLGFIETSNTKDKTSGGNILTMQMSSMCTMKPKCLTKEEAEEALLKAAIDYMWYKEYLKNWDD